MLNQSCHYADYHKGRRYGPFLSLSCRLYCRSVTPDDWAAFSDNNMANAERERHASAKLRAVADDVLSQTSNDLSTQRRAVNDAFRRRCEELAEAKQGLEEHLEKVCERGRLRQRR